MAVQPGTRVGSDALFAAAGDGLSVLRGEAGHSWADRSGDALSGHCRPVAPGQKRRFDAAGRGAGQHDEGLVAVRAGSLLLRPCVQPHAGDRLSVLRGEEGVAGVQRSGDAVPEPCAGVAPGAQRRADAAGGHEGEPQADLVAVPGGSHVESDGLCPDEAEWYRMSCVCRYDKT